jgi:hypothetical protein
VVSSPRILARKENTMLRKTGPFFVALALATLACGGRTDGDSTGGTGGSGGSGAGGSGGSATGGSGGGGTGGSGAADAGPSDGGCGCITGRLEWGMNGGHVFFTDTSSLDMCNVFGHQRLPNAPDPPGLSCTQAISACPSGSVSADAVERAMNDPAVKAAIAAAPILYGEDSRPVDGQVFRLLQGRAVVEVGNPCAATSCKAIPAGVQTLVNTLKQLTKEQLGREPCRSNFPNSAIESPSR